MLDACPPLRVAAAAGEVVYDLNFDLVVGGAQWNVDLVIGTPPPGLGAPVDEPITRSTPSLIQIAVELKAVMTEHHKAVKNRKRDFEAHHEHVHNYDGSGIAAGLLLVNGAERFQSPLRKDVTLHRNPRDLVRHCVREMTNVSHRGGPTGYGLDAKCVLVVDMDNIETSEVSYIDRPPAPQVGDPLHYDSFIARLCALYRDRFHT